MATRAAQYSSHLNSSKGRQWTAVARRASLVGGHSSGNDIASPRTPASHSSSSSGRERRRAGKTGMQKTIMSQQSRIAELEEQVAFLKDVIRELSASVATAPRDVPSNAAIFDLFDYEEDAGAFVEAGTQTDISVCHQYPDVFVRMPQSHTPCEALACSSEVEHAAATDAVNANADVSVASAPTRVCAAVAALPQSLTPCEVEHAADIVAVNANADVSVASVSASLCAADAAAGGFGKGLSPQTLANTVEPFTTGCNNLPTAGSLAHASPRAFDAISECVPRDFYSQDLANHLQCGPSASRHQHCSHASPRAFDAISEGVPHDFNSQDLANVPQCGPNAFTQLRTADMPCETARLVSSPTPPILAETGVGSPRTTPSTPGSSNPGSSSCAAKDFDSQNLAKTVELLVDGPYHAPGGEGTSVTTPGTSACASKTSQVSALDDVFPRAKAVFVSKNVCEKGTASRGGLSDDNPAKQQCGRKATAHRNNTATELFDAIAVIDDPPGYSSQHPANMCESLPEHRPHTASPELFDAINEHEQTPLAAAAGSQQAIGDSIAALKARIAAQRPLVEDQQPSQQELRIRYEKQQRELKAQRRKGKGKGKGARS